VNISRIGGQDVQADKRNGWFDEDRRVPLEQALGGTGQSTAKTIRIRRPAPSVSNTSGDTEINAGGTVVRIRDRRAVREPIPEFHLRETAEDRMAAVRAAARLAAAPKRTRAQEIAEFKADINARQRAMRQAEYERFKQTLEEAFWMGFPFVAGGLGAVMLLAGAARMNPMLVILGLSMGFLAWKGKKVAGWFDAKEAERKAKRAERERLAVESAAQARIDAQSGDPADKITDAYGAGKS
jgi:hypothetical protein